MPAADLRSDGLPEGEGAIFPARRLTDALKAAGPPLLFGLRLWASVSLALYLAFWLELDEPFWAGTSPAIAFRKHYQAACASVLSPAPRTSPTSLPTSKC
jgi:hypothetical protein